VTLVWQLSGSAVTSAGRRQQELADRVAEYSGGKVQLELYFGNALVGAADAADALGDGRLDLHLLRPQLQPADFPVSGRIVPEATTTRPTAFVSGQLAMYGALNEALLSEPALQAEYDARGLTVLIPAPEQPVTVIACSEPAPSLAALAGRQIRVESAEATAQVESLGLTAVTIAPGELYEAVQRGIVDCIVTGFAQHAGLVEFMPHLMVPVGASLVQQGTGIELAGYRWAELPLTVRQLLYDQLSELHLAALPGLLDTGRSVVEAAEAAGGGVVPFEEDVNEALRAYNARVVASWSQSPLLDGEAFRGRLEAAYARWSAFLDRSGVPDVELADVNGWNDATVGWDAFLDAYREQLVVPNRPG